MKKLSLYVFLVLMFCNTSFAKCIKGDCINGFGTWTWDFGTTYVGEFKNGKFHGQGTIKRKSGTTVGEFRNDHAYDVVATSHGSVITSEEFYETIRCYPLFRGPDYGSPKTVEDIESERVCIAAVAEKSSAKKLIESEKDRMKEVKEKNRMKKVKEEARRTKEFYKRLEEDQKRREYYESKDEADWAWEEAERTRLEAQAAENRAEEALREAERRLDEQSIREAELRIEEAERAQWERRQAEDRARDAENEYQNTSNY